MWAFMTEQSITIDVTTRLISPVREKDSPIMECIMNNKSLADSDITIANKCRIYLRAFLLTDIVTGCGKKIRKTVWEGTRDTQNSDPSILWPEWKHPPTKMWTV